jgi:hypothetical protein
LSARIFCAAALTCSRLFRRERGAPTRAARIWSALSAAAMRCSHSAETIVSACRVGLKVMDGGGFAASLDEFSKAWAIYFPDVVSSKSKKALTKM